MVGDLWVSKFFTKLSFLKECLEIIILKNPKNKKGFGMAKSICLPT
jgi:hypothetical protein